MSMFFRPRKIIFERNYFGSEVWIPIIFLTILIKMTKLILFESAVDPRTELNILTSGIKQYFPAEELKHVRVLQKFVLKKEDV